MDISPDSPDCTEITNSPAVDSDDNFSTVVSSRLGGHSLLYAAETDGCIESGHKSLSNYCELKTSVGKSRDDLAFDRNPKFLKWWLQCYLVCIERIYVGMRSKEGIVSRIVECRTSQIYQGNNNKVTNFRLINKAFLRF